MAAGLCALFAAPAYASLAAVRAAGERLAAERSAALAAGPEAERRLIDDLGKLVLELIDDSDALQRGGREQSERPALRDAFTALHAPLSALYEERRRQMEGAARAVMDTDGDLEALYEGEEWRTSQSLAAQALYYLNWLEYYGARAYDGARRAELLRSAERGFSQFAAGEATGELGAESLLGRGLCNLELGKIDWAVRDFTLVADGEASDARKAKARLALLDAYARSGDRERTLAYARELLERDRVAEEDQTLVRFYQLMTLLDAADAARGARAAEYRREAGDVMRQVRRAGPAWAKKVDVLVVSRVDDPAAWAGEAATASAQWQLARLLLARDDCANAEPLLAKVLTAPVEEGAAFAAEARYWLGVCHFKAARYRDAAEAMAAALGDAPDAAFAADARYLRFKAYEALLADAANAALAPAYVESMRALIDNDPQHKQAFEARYRLGEYLQGAGEFAAAIAAYDAVAGDPVFVLRARFGCLQSRFEMLRAEVNPRRRDELLAQIGDDLARYDEQAGAVEEAKVADSAIAELSAKVALLRAVHLSLRGGDSAAVAAQLEDFSARFPAATDLQPQAVRMRLTALQRAGDFSAAAAEVARSRQLLRAEGQGKALQALADAYGRSAREGGDAAVKSAAAGVALELYALAEASGQTRGSQQRIAVAQLREQSGDLAAAVAAYEQILTADPNAIAALRGLAAIAERRGDLAAARRYWFGYTEKVRGGDTAWFRGQYEQARLAVAAGEAQAACARLAAMRQMMPALRDESLRGDLTALHGKSCK